MAYRKVNDNSLVSVADAIRSKGGTSDALVFPDGFVSAISAIQTGGGGAKETWVIKSSAGGEFATTQISFTSNGQKFTSIGAVYDGLGFILHYDNNEIANYDPVASSGYEFYNDAYRKLTFDTSPAGSLLTWLQSNATKQPDDTAVQDTKALTITSNGTVSVTPDAPYDGLSSVDVTVNVSGGGSETQAGRSVTFPATATRWTNIEEALLVISDGTSVHFEDYSVVAGKTINNVICIIAYSTRAYDYLRLTLAIGTIVQLDLTGGTADVYMTKAPGATMTRMGSSKYTLFMPTEDVTLSAIEMYNTD